MTSTAIAETVAVEHEYEGLPEGTPIWINLAAGAFAGIAEHTLTYPFDSIKTRMQIVKPHPDAIYASTMDAIRRASSAEGGLRRLWRGVFSVVIGAGPAHALYFASYEQAKKVLVPVGSDAASNPFATGISGAIATSIADGFMTPFDVIKQRMQVHGSVHSNVVRCGLDIMKREGPSAFFVSYPTTLILNIPFQMIQFPTYEFFRREFLRVRNLDEQSYDPMSHVLSGGIAGGLAAAVTTPIDVIKTTLQTRGLSEEALNKVSGVKDAIRFVFKERGWSGFVRGLSPRVLTHVPATAICWTCYEYLKWTLS